MSSNPGEGMYVCKYIVPSRHGSSLTSHRAASPLVRLVEGEERREAPNHPQGVLSQNWGGTEQIVLPPAWYTKRRLTTGVNI
ncbi:uncharacterized protein TNCV_667171 [Trichonephila clavipes]|nr:uncharacterized protein TNCV_667171 [Trichonephila clavipes]